MSKPTRLEYLLVTRTARALNPQLAFDAKVDYSPVFAGITTKNFAERKTKIVPALAALLKGRTIAQDAELSGVKSMVEKITHPDGSGPEQSLDESVSGPQHRAMEAAAHGASNLDIPKNVGEEFSEADKGKTFHDALPEFLRGKGMSEDDVSAVMDMLPKRDPLPEPAIKGADEGGEEARQAAERAKAVGDESPEDKEKREREEREKAAKDKAMTHDELSKAVKDAVASNTKAIRDAERGVRVALGDVKPWVGELPVSLSFDSAEQVHRHAAKMMKLKGADTLHADALLPVIQAQPKPGARPAERGPRAAEIAQDSADDFSKMFPDAGRIQVGA